MSSRHIGVVLLLVDLGLLVHLLLNGRLLLVVRRRLLELSRWLLIDDCWCLLLFDSLHPGSLLRHRLLLNLLVLNVLNRSLLDTLLIQWLLLLVERLLLHLLRDLLVKHLLV